ncbi:MAG: ABC transporter substrate-binding protein [Chitinophagaceae bacterium]|nr:ABC transporter substrate-binding protein [Chitinophagaceae bacterium]MCW5905252.1 ABC transporter substrate-binding protein [Chitinophagaceae bacterium]
MLNTKKHIAPKRIISLVPSQTELLYDLGLEEEVIGITKFCIHPNIWYRNKTRVGGVKSIDIKKIIELKPDLIIANKEENVKEQIETLQPHFPVHVTDVSTLAEAYNMIQTIGALTHTEQKAITLINAIKNSFTNIHLSQNEQPKKVCYLIWRNPYMSVGGDTFISNMLHHAGYKNIFDNKKRYPETTLEEINSLQPDYIFLSSEPYPFKEKHIEEIKPKILSKPILVNGEMFTWYGSRLLKSAVYFKKLAEELLNVEG